jgi:hypothetical protein
MATSANQQGVVGAASGAIWMWTEACVILGVSSPFKMTGVCFVDLLRRHLFLSFDKTSTLLSTLFLISPACCDLVAQLVGSATLTDDDLEGSAPARGGASSSTSKMKASSPLIPRASESRVVEIANFVDAGTAIWLHRQVRSDFDAETL